MLTYKSVYLESKIERKIIVFYVIYEYYFNLKYVYISSIFMICFAKSTLESGWLKVKKNSISVDPCSRYIHPQFVWRTWYFSCGIDRVQPNVLYQCIITVIDQFDSVFVYYVIWQILKPRLSCKYGMLFIYNLPPKIYIHIYIWSFHTRTYNSY